MMKHYPKFIAGSKAIEDLTEDVGCQSTGKN